MIAVASERYYYAIAFGCLCIFIGVKVFRRWGWHRSAGTYAEAQGSAFVPTIFATGITFVVVGIVKLITG
jgi:hypothetical protein